MIKKSKIPIKISSLIIIKKKRKPQLISSSAYNWLLSTHISIFTHSINIRLSSFIPWNAHRIFIISIIRAENLLNHPDYVWVAILIIQFPILTSDNFRPSKQPTSFKLGGSPSFSNFNS